MKMIVAHASNNVIGINGRLPWHIPEELNWFHEYTKENVNVLFGGRTYDELSSLKFKDRKVFVLSRTMRETESITVFRSVQEVVKFSESNLLVVAGGTQVYKMMLPYVNELMATEVFGDYVGDAFCPEYKHLFRFSHPVHIHPKFIVSKYVRRS